MHPTGDLIFPSGFPTVASTRRLAAIMFTDMVGSTAAAQANEAAALRLRDEQAELVRPLFKTHQGREIKSMGDGFLAEFDSALRAVQCAIDILQHLHERNSQPGASAIQLRIGVHLGDVEERETDIFGDAVNIASRIEPLASPGGLSISGQVFDQVRNKIPNRLEKYPPTSLKGLEVPIDIYRVVLPWDVREISSGADGQTRLAVLPFTNMSPDPADLYFADGLTEELITVLSQIRELLVIARTSVMQYKSTTKAISQIGAELSVSSVLEGSVRRAGNRLRITAQLIDVGSQGHVWAKSYDRELDDVFVIQTEIAKQVAEALKIELRPPEKARLEARPTERPDSYLAYLKGRTLLHGYDPTSLQAAKGQFELAISLDPNNAAAHSGLADAIWMSGIWYTDVHQTKWEETIRRLAERAIELDPNLAEAHTSLAVALWARRDYGAMEKELKLALSLNPSYPPAHQWYAGILEDEGRAEEALRELSLAEAADPLGKLTLSHLALLLIWLGKLDEALVKIQKFGELEPFGRDYHGLLFLYYLTRSDLDLSLKELQRSEELEPEPRRRRALRALRYALSGEKEQARALLQQEEALPEFGQIPEFVAEVYAELGDLDACFRWLERQGPALPLQSWRLSPRLEKVRRDPRFQTLLRKMKLA
jgi:adenylate cyclase